MTKLEALNEFMGYCDRFLGELNIDRNSFNQMNLMILNSSDQRFENCINVKDVIRELGFDWMLLN